MGQRRPDKRGNRVRHVDGHKMDYRSPADMKLAAQVQDDRRGGTSHEYVIGGFKTVNHAVVLFAVEQSPAFQITGNLTNDSRFYRRWRTKQAASQWAQRQLWTADLHVWKLTFLDVLPHAESSIAFRSRSIDTIDLLTAGQSAGTDPA